MMTLQTLQNISIDELLQVFNLSFSDYVVPFSLTKEHLEDKIKSDSINLGFSVGAFEENKLIAFLLHGYDLVDNLKIVYNAGTGVIPVKRGHRLTAKMYEYLLPVLYKNSIDKILLEVITTNEAAIKTYKNIGFKIVRKLNCFKGSIEIANSNNDFEICELNEYDWQVLQDFWDFEPSWQNSITAVEILKQSNVSIGVYKNKKLLGYAIYNPKLKRIHQIAVDKSYRKRGVGRPLLEFISTRFGNEISIINIDDNSKEISSFLTHSGMKIFIEQHEMELNLK